MHVIGDGIRMAINRGHVRHLDAVGAGQVARADIQIERERVTESGKEEEMIGRSIAI